MSTPDTRAECYVRVQGRGQPVIFDMPQTLSYRRALNEVGDYSLVLSADDDRLDVFTLDAQIEVWRSYPGLGIPWYRDFAGLHQNTRIRTDANGQHTFTSTGVTYNDLLARRIVAYPEGSAGAAKSGLINEIMRAYALENIGPSATIARGRYRDGQMAGINVSAILTDTATYWEGDRSMENLLDVMQDLADISGLYFEVVPELDQSGYNLYLYGQYGQTFGRDLTATLIDPISGRNRAGFAPIIFSLDHDTVLDIEYENDHMGERTVMFTTGEVDGQDTTVYVESLDLLESNWNDREAVTTSGGAGEEETIEALFARADEALRLTKQQTTIRFTPKSHPNAIYGYHFALGDWVTAVYAGFTLGPQIWGVRVTRDGRSNVETVALELRGGD